MLINREMLVVEGDCICESDMLSHAVFVFFGHLSQVSDYCNTFTNKIVGKGQRVLHVCGDLICSILADQLSQFNIVSLRCCCDSIVFVL